MQWVRRGPPAGIGSRRQAAFRISEAHERGATAVDLAHLGLHSLPACLAECVGLEVLTVQGNMLAALPADLPDTLTHLTAFHNEIAVLPHHLPASITTLELCNNLLTALPVVLPASLTYLNVSSNRLTALPPQLPTALQSLYVSNNQIVDLPAVLPNTLRYLEVERNPLSATTRQRLLRLSDRVLIFPDRRSLSLQDDTATTPTPSHPPGPSNASNPPDGAAGSDSSAGATSPAMQQQRRLASQPTDLIAALYTQGLFGTFALLSDTDSDVGSDFSLDLDTASGLSRAAIAGSPTRAGSPPAVATPDALDTCIAEWTASAAGYRAENNAPAFANFLGRLRETASYAHRQAPQQADFVARITDLLAALHASAALRTVCFGIAEDASATCGDRVAFALNEMELARINDDAERGRYGPDELFAMGQGFFRLRVLDDIASAHIRASQAAGDTVDEIEVRLGYQTMLATELDLPGVEETMLYPGCTGIRQENLRLAASRVRSAESRDASVQFMAQWPPWQRMIEQREPAPFETLRLLFAAERDDLVILPPRMSEQEWIDACAAQTTHEAQELVRLTARMTRRYLLDAGLE